MKGAALIKDNRNGKQADEVKSPETIAWDNPFPTFPNKHKQNPPTEPSSLHTSTAQSSLDDSASQHKAPGTGPRTGYSKNSHSSSRRSKESVFERYSDDKTGFKAPEHASTFDNPHTGSTKQDGQVLEDPHHTNSIAHGGPSGPGAHINGYSGSRAEQLRAPPVMQSRRSEDNNSRPSIPLCAPSTYSDERSKTMPATITESVVESGLILAEAPPSWQEPGSIAGYYGPGDRGFLPMEHSSQQRPPGPPRSQSDDSKWGKQSTKTLTANFIPPQTHPTTEIIGDILDAYHEDPPAQYGSYQQDSVRNRLAAADDEMPNFDAAADTGGRRRGMTLDEHLRPQAGNHINVPPMPSRKDLYEQQNLYVADYPGTEIPRSRSQPNFGGGRPPPPEQVQGFDFGVPAAADKRPATSAAPGDHGNGSRFPVTHPPDTWNGPNSHRYHNNPRPATAQGYRQNRGPDSRSIGREPIQKERHRLPPMPDGRPPNDRMRYPRTGPSPVNTTPLTSPPHKPPFNPDTLPHHPAPLRPGLANGPQSSQAPRPAPVRQYNGAPDPVQQPGGSRSTDGDDGAGRVTHQELEALRQKTLRSPSDQATQLLLAKKLTEAAAVLVDERADPHTRKRNRDKYNSDALKIIKKLSANSYPEADFYYADCYSRGVLGLQSDIKEAFTLYQKAAKANHPQAAYRVAVCCEIGQEEGGGTKRDPVKAMQWYRRAATLGDVAAMYKMGVIQLKGLLGQPKDPRDAVTWLKRAAERADKENPHALHELALLHEKPTNLEGVIQDEAYSRQLFTQAAHLGYKFSQFRLGCAYEYGLLGCPVDPRQSIGWYSKAAVQEEHQSELALSGWYLTGAEGVLQQSDTEAYLWARKAAQAGLAKAEYAMGYFTEVGIGAPANLEDAKRWYWRSASQNFPKARDRLEDLRKGGAAKQKARVSRSNMKKQSDGECSIM
ncbi:MAG: hypothetical protein Q9163_001342 [Psora crenata]